MRPNVNFQGRLQRGLTLIEMMVAMVLALLLTAAVLQVYLLNKTTFTAQQQSGIVQESGNFALEYLTRDARMAGLAGCSSRRSGTQPLPVHNYLNSTAYPFDLIGHGISGFESTGTGVGATYNITATNPAPGGGWTPALPTGANALDGKALPGSDVLVVSGISPDDIPLVAPFTSGSQIFVDDVRDITNGEILVVTNCQQAEVFQATNVVSASNNIVGSSAGSYTPGNAENIASTGPEGPFTEGTRVSRLRSYAYYVGRGTDGTPSLYRASLRGSAMEDQELVPGVDSMQIVYGVDGNEDYIVDDYRDASAVTDWQQVRAIRVSLLMRSPEEFLDGMDTATYNLAGTTINPVDDRRQRRVFSSTIALRNRLL